MVYEVPRALLEYEETFVHNKRYGLPWACDMSRNTLTRNINSRRNPWLQTVGKYKGATLLHQLV